MADNSGDTTMQNQDVIQRIGKHDQRASSAKAVYRERRSKRPTDHKGA